MNPSARPAFARTLIAGFVGGSLLTDGATDLAADNALGWLWLFFGTAAVLLLIQHLREQALRGRHRPDATWSRTDTANAVILFLLVPYILIGSLADKTIQPAEEGAGYLLGAVYLALLIDFILQRRQVVQASTHSTPTPATPPTA